MKINPSRRNNRTQHGTLSVLMDQLAASTSPFNTMRQKAEVNGSESVLTPSSCIRLQAELRGGVGGAGDHGRKRWTPTGVDVLVRLKVVSSVPWCSPPCSLPRGFLSLLAARLRV